MRKLMTGLIAVVTALSITACGGGGGSQVSSKAKSVGKKAIEITDSYLDQDTEYKDATDQLDNLVSDGLDYVATEDTNKDTYVGDSSVETRITLISHDILMDGVSGTSETYDGVLEDRNALADLVGEDRR